MIAENFGTLLRRSQIMTGRLSTVRKSARAAGSRIGAANRSPCTMTTRHAMLNRTFMPGFWSILSRIIAGRRWALRGGASEGGYVRQRSNPMAPDSNEDGVDGR